MNKPTSSNESVASASSTASSTSTTRYMTRSQTKSLSTSNPTPVTTNASASESGVYEFDPRYLVFEFVWYVIPLVYIIVW